MALASAPCSLATSSARLLLVSRDGSVRNPFCLGLRALGSDVASVCVVGWVAPPPQNGLKPLPPVPEDVTDLKKQGSFGCN